MKKSIETKVVEQVDFDITIDGTLVKVTNPNFTIYDVAKSAGINIPAPCFGDNRKFGGCKVCVVEIAGKHSYACRKMPKKGMNITFDREDLNELRRERISVYTEKVKLKSK